VSVPLVFLTYYNPILAFGLKAFCRTAVEAGIDGVIVPDVPPEEAAPLRAEADPAGLDVVHLVAPTSTPERMRKIARASQGFIYMVSLTGVTGERSELAPELAAQLRGLRNITTKPICVGFGISTPAQAAEVGRAADGVIVGSAIVRHLRRAASTRRGVHCIAQGAAAGGAVMPVGATRGGLSYVPAPLSNAGAQTWPPHSPSPRTFRVGD